LDKRRAKRSGMELPSRKEQFAFLTLILGGLFLISEKENAEKAVYKSLLKKSQLISNSQKKNASSLPK
jgi:hypothetical protein